MKDVKKYIEENKDRFLEELFELIRIPSISAESEHKPDMVRCAEKWKEFLLKAGCDKAEVMPSDRAGVWPLRRDARGSLGVVAHTAL